MDDNEKVDFEIEEHTSDLIAQRFGQGWFYSFDGDIKTGPFETQEAARNAAIELIEQSVAEALTASLFGEKA
ncbi:hypothetical protein [Pararhizobium qamdonense]|uniref:hypothetical protein n=1 Tax=Pararhizobium qamdonense TaxID=3031126 RepID=UPI0023E0AE51|nr:hypothetical protein [Pararhizobium qamdonense]